MDVQVSRISQLNIVILRCIFFADITLKNSLITISPWLPSHWKNSRDKLVREVFIFYPWKGGDFYLWKGGDFYPLSGGDFYPLKGGDFYPIKGGDFYPLKGGDFYPLKGGDFYPLKGGDF